MKSLVSRYKDKLEEMDTLLAVKSQDYGQVPEIIDVVGEMTGYDSCKVSLAEQAATVRMLSKLVRLMNMRAKGCTRLEALENIKDIVGEAMVCWSAVNRNTTIGELQEEEKREKNRSHS